MNSMARTCLHVFLLFLVLEGSWSATLQARTVSQARFNFGKSVETHAKNLDTNLQLMDSILDVVQKFPQDSQGKHLLEMGKSLLHRVMKDKPFVTPNSASPFDLMLSSSLLTPTLTRAVSSLQTADATQMEALSTCVRSKTQSFDAVVHNTTVVCLTDLMEKSEHDLEPITAISLDKMTSCIKDMSFVSEILRVFRKCAPESPNAATAQATANIFNTTPTNSSQELTANVLAATNAVITQAMGSNTTSQSVPGMHAGRPGGPDYSKSFAFQRNMALITDFLSDTRRGTTNWFTGVLSVAAVICIVLASSLWGLHAQGMHEISNIQTGFHIAKYWIEACEGVAAVLLMLLPWITRKIRDSRLNSRFACTYRTRSTYRDNIEVWKYTHKMFHYNSFVEDQLRSFGNIVHHHFHESAVPDFEEWLHDGPMGFDHTDVTFKHFDALRALISQFPICDSDINDPELMKELKETGLTRAHTKAELDEALHAIYRFRVHKLVSQRVNHGAVAAKDDSGFTDNDTKLIRRALLPSWIKMKHALELTEKAEGISESAYEAEEMIHKYVLVALAVHYLLEFVDLEGECKSLNKDDGTPRGATESEYRFFRAGYDQKKSWPVNPLFHSRMWECIDQLPGHAAHASAHSLMQTAASSWHSALISVASGGEGSVDVPTTNRAVEFTSHGNVEKGAVCLLKCQDGYSASYGTTVCDDLGGGGMIWSHLNAGIKMHGKGQMIEPGCCIAGPRASQINPNMNSLHVAVQNHAAYFYFEPGFNRACLSASTLDRYPTDTMGFVMQACNLESIDECDKLAEAPIHTLLDQLASTHTTEHSTGSADHSTTESDHTSTDTTATSHESSTSAHDEEHLVVNLQVSTDDTHAATDNTHAATDDAHAATDDAHAATDDAHAATDDAHATTDDAHATTDDAHAATGTTHAQPSSPTHVVSQFLNIPFIAGNNPNDVADSQLAIYNFDSRTATGLLPLPDDFAPKHFRLVSYNVFGIVRGGWFLRDLERSKHGAEATTHSSPH